VTELSQVEPLLVFRGSSLSTDNDYRALLVKGLSSARKSSWPRLDLIPASSSLKSRLPLVLELHAQGIQTYQNSGSTRSVMTEFNILRNFYSFCDALNADPTVSNVVELFLKWSDERSKSKSPSHHYSSATRVAKVLSQASDIPREKFVIPARLRKPSKAPKIYGSHRELSMESELAFCRMLLSLSKALTKNAIEGPLPLIVEVAADVKIEFWAGLPKTNALRCQESRARLDLRREGTVGRRYALVNLKIECELLIFISQTGMNAAQAFSLACSDLAYESSGDGYAVRPVYKSRRKGGVIFEIHKSYRRVLDNYLRWRTEVCAKGEKRLFPFINRANDPTRTEASYYGLKRVLAGTPIVFFGARHLRSIRANWLLRATNSPQITASMNQHSVGVLLESYVVPSHSVATREITNFWSERAPGKTSVGPGVCGRIPEQAQGATDAFQPDCRTAIGCLFCSNNRDEYSQDHAWSLATYRYLRVLELSSYGPAFKQGGMLVREAPSAEAALAAVSKRLESMAGFDSTAAAWVEEAHSRVREGDYHPKWSILVRSAELTR